MRGRRGAALVLLPLAVVGIGAAFLADEGPGPVPLHDRPIVAATLACPDLGMTPPGAGDPLEPAGGVRLDVRTGGLADGRVTVAPGDREVRTARGAGRLTLPPVEGGGRDGALQVAARDRLAPGLSATVTAPGDGAGPARARCVPASSRTWFVGPSTVAGRDPVVVFANLSDQPSQAAVRVFADGPAGPARQVSVPAGGTLTRRLAAFAPEATVTALDVEVTAGRLLVWVSDRSSAAGPFAASRFVPATAPPASRLLLGGVVVPVGPPAPAATLALAAPGRAATVRVSVLTQAGSRVPVGLEAVRVPAGGAIAVPAPLPAGAASAVLVESTATGAGGAATGAPVVAGLGVASGWPGVWTWAVATRIQSSSGGQGLDAYGRGTGLSRLDGPTSGAGTAPDAVVAVPPTPPGAAGAVVLTAPLGPVTAWLDGAEVRLRPGSVAALPVPTGPGGGSLSAVGGPLVATVVSGAAPMPGAGVRAAPAAGAGPAAGAMLPRILSAVVPLSGAARVLDVPAVVADPAVAYR
ncbi:DUF5719 family protein [Frankia sp. AgB32]|uniref:DUF5719 family protein n=1 Tax=Frankia sp. AgB32 TaxID=631119 RepID=UPI00200D56C6|nr:DUF5719 family protein [Frankia sp. AgB32]MCK9893801.1 DUF5719 family protein [Frankia sp. AgB32]